jgi:hypothetical protein
VGGLWTLGPELSGFALVLMSTVMKQVFIPTDSLSTPRVQLCTRV